jgi:PTS system ascorbate-specific IIA component
MLKDLVEAPLIQLGMTAADWEDAVRVAAAPLVENGKVTPAYVDDIIVGAKEHGPYFVLTEHVAMPHARPECGALDSAIGITTLKTPVDFGSPANDPVKYLFCLSAKDDDDHIAALQSLVELLGNPEFFKVLDEATSAEDVLEFIRNAEEGTE